MTSYPFFDGFETNDKSKWDNETVNAATDNVTSNPYPVFKGNYALQASVNAIGSYIQLGKTAFSGPTYYTRIYINFTTNINAGENIEVSPYYYDGGYGGPNNCIIRLNRIDASNWQWTIHDFESAFDYMSPNFTLFLNRWYCLEFKLVQDLIVGELRLYVDGVQTISQTGLNTGSATQMNVQIEVYASNTNTPQIYYIDEVTINNGYIGPEPPQPFLSWIQPK